MRRDSLFLFIYIYSPSLEYPPVFFINWIQPALLSVIVLSQSVSLRKDRRKGTVGTSGCFRLITGGGHTRGELSVVHRNILSQVIEWRKDKRWWSVDACVCPSQHTLPLTHALR